MHKRITYTYDAIEDVSNGYVLLHASQHGQVFITIHAMWHLTYVTSVIINHIQKALLHMVTVYLGRSTCHVHYLRCYISNN